MQVDVYNGRKTVVVVVVCCKEITSAIITCSAPHWLVIHKILFHEKLPPPPAWPLPKLPYFG